MTYTLIIITAAFGFFIPNFPNKEACEKTIQEVTTKYYLSGSRIKMVCAEVKQVPGDPI